MNESRGRRNRRRAGGMGGDTGERRAEREGLREEDGGLRLTSQAGQARGVPGKARRVFSSEISPRVRIPEKVGSRGRKGAEKAESHCPWARGDSPAAQRLGLMMMGPAYLQVDQELFDWGSMDFGAKQSSTTS